MLFFVSVLNFLDRQVLAIVQEDIKLELGLSDSQLGMLALAFGAVHGLSALPVGRLADRFSRKKVLLGCLTVWSSITLLTGFVSSFGQLLATRIGVAMGEAGVTPTTYAMISDRFPLRQRARAIAAVAVGTPVGLMLSLLLGGLIAESLGWRMTFVLFGAPGLLLAAVIYFTLKAPPRGGADGLTDLEPIGFADAMKRLLSVRTYVLVLLGATAHAVVGYGMVQWMPSFYMRKFDVDAAEVGLTLGPVIGITGLLGVAGGAFLADWLSRRDLRWYAWIVSICLIGAYPLLVVNLFVGSYVLALAAYTGANLLGSGVVAVINALIQSSTPVQGRGTAAGLKTVCLSLVGYGLGGMLIGWLSDYFSSDAPGASLGHALMAVSFFQLLAALLFLFAAQTLRKDFSESVTRSVSLSGGKSEPGER